MRRLIVEFSINELRKNKSVDVSRLQKVKMLKILQVLRQDQEEMTAIGRIELEDEVPNIEDFVRLISDNVFEVKLIEREKTGAYVVFVKQKLPKPQKTISKEPGADIAYVVSREIRERQVRLTFIGSASQMGKVFEDFQKLKMRYKIVSLTDARFSLDSPLNILTEKQREVLIAAYRLGYYDSPRRISSRQLAKKLNLTKSTLATHSRKAELRLIAHIVTE